MSGMTPRHLRRTTGTCVYPPPRIERPQSDSLKIHTRLAVKYLLELRRPAHQKRQRSARQNRQPVPIGECLFVCLACSTAPIFSLGWSGITRLANSPPLISLRENASAPLDLLTFSLLFSPAFRPLGIRIRTASQRCPSGTRARATSERRAKSGALGQYSRLRRRPWLRVPGLRHRRHPLRSPPAPAGYGPPRCPPGGRREFGFCESRQVFLECREWFAVVGVKCEASWRGAVSSFNQPFPAAGA